MPSGSALPFSRPISACRLRMYVCILRLSPKYLATVAQVTTDCTYDIGLNKISILSVIDRRQLKIMNARPESSAFFLAARCRLCRFVICYKRGRCDAAFSQGSSACRGQVPRCKSAVVRFNDACCMKSLSNPSIYIYIWPSRVAHAGTIETMIPFFIGWELWEKMVFVSWNIVISAWLDLSSPIADAFFHWARC